MMDNSFKWNLKDGAIIKNILAAESLLAAIPETIKQLPSEKQAKICKLNKQIYLIACQITNISNKIQSDLSATYGEDQYLKLAQDTFLFIDRASGRDEECRACIIQKEKLKQIKAGNINQFLKERDCLKNSCIHKEVCKFSAGVCSAGCAHYEKIKGDL